MDRVKVQAIRTKLDQLLKTAFPEYIISLGNATFNVNEVTFKRTNFIDRVTGFETPVTSKPELDWNARAGSLGMERKWLGKDFEWQGMRYKIIGLMPNRRKYPVLVETFHAKKKQLFTVSMIRGTMLNFGTRNNAVPDPAHYDEGES